MVVLGVMLKGNVARLVALSGRQSAHTVVKSRVNKLELSKNPTKDDVDTFVQAFKSFCLNLRRTTDRQRLVDLYSAIGDRSFVPAGHDGSGVVGGLLFTKSSVQARIASFAIQVRLNVQQVSELTGSHYDAVKGWIDNGLLPASKSSDLQGQPWLVDLRDLVQILLRFSPLACLAKQVGSSSRGLSAALTRRGVQTALGDQERGAVVRT